MKVTWQEIFEDGDFGTSPTKDICLDLGSHESMWLFPGEFVLASTLEYFNVPRGVLLTLHDKSTLARLGLVVGNTLINPGSRGHQTLELSNRGPHSITLTHGMPIAQLVQHACDEGYYYAGRYQDQEPGPHEARP